MPKLVSRAVGTKAAHNPCATMTPRRPAAAAHNARIPWEASDRTVNPLRPPPSMDSAAKPIHRRSRAWPAVGGPSLQGVCPLLVEATSTDSRSALAGGDFGRIWRMMLGQSRHVRRMKHAMPDSGPSAVGRTSGEEGADRFRSPTCLNPMRSCLALMLVWGRIVQPDSVPCGWTEVWANPLHVPKSPGPHTPCPSAGPDAVSP